VCRALFIIVFEDMKVSFSVRQLGWMLWVVGGLNALLWLDALDNYLEARFEWSLSSYLPRDWFEPSRRMANAVKHLTSHIGRHDPEAERAQTQPGPTAKPAPPAMSLPFQALPALPCPALLCLALPCLALPYPALPFIRVLPAVPCLAIPCHVSPFKLSCLDLPCAALPSLRFPSLAWLSLLLVSP
jgi:hypothetical protein